MSDEIVIETLDIGRHSNAYRAEAKKIAQDLVISDARVKELWKEAAHDYPAFIALLKAEPQGCFDSHRVPLQEATE